MNVARSGLYFFLSQMFDVGDGPRVKRLFRPFYKRRPSFPRYFITWDIKKLLNFLSWHPISSLFFKKLTLKTLTIVSVTSSDRAQTIKPIDIENSEVTENGIFFLIYSLLKCSKKIRPVRVVKCIKFDEPSLDVCSYVIAYMQKSLKYRIRDVNKGLPNPRQLFLSYSTGKPLRRATISKYLLEVLSLAGIDTSTFKAHSYRGALPSIMSKRCASPGQILAQGDWQQMGTFERYYNRYADNSVEGRLIAQVTGANK